MESGAIYGATWYSKMVDTLIFMPSTHTSDESQRNMFTLALG
jgi:hypothetical protein